MLAARGLVGIDWCCDAAWEVPGAVSIAGRLSSRSLVRKAGTA
jgi:hypothetical protein